VAKELLGKVLAHQTPQGLVGGVIVETEAYYGYGDPASHACRGPTPRNTIMYGRPGIAYIYLNYGMYFLLNVVTEKKGKPGAVLIRALEPATGENIMLQYRPVDSKLQLTSGPGKLTQALDIDLSLLGADLTSGSLVIKEGLKRRFSIDKDFRVGVREDSCEPLRFYMKESQFVSRK
jgi:DNA-3-methyladenine glycosylase